MNKARMTFRFDGQETTRTKQSEPLWDPANGQPMEPGDQENSASSAAPLDKMRSAELNEHNRSFEQGRIIDLNRMSDRKRTAERGRRPDRDSGGGVSGGRPPLKAAKAAEQAERRSYADMNAAISNWPEEDMGNPFQAHSGLGAYGYPEPEDNAGRGPVIEQGGEQPPILSYEPEGRLDRDNRYTQAGGGQGPVWRDDPVHHRPPARGSRWKVVGSVTGAVITGALFGMVVLSLFNKEVDFPIPGLAAISESAQKAADSLPAVGELKQEEVSGASVQISLPAQDYFFLQYGVFSSQDGVTRAQQELQDAGYAAAQDTLDNKRVYAAISSDREQAKLLSSEMKADGVDLILHEAAIPSTASVHYSLEAGTLEQYAQQSADLVKLLSGTSASLLLEQQPDLTADLTADLKEKHVQFTQSAAAVRDGFSGSGKQLIQNMETEMNSAVEALLQFDKTKAKSHLWEVQNSMMRYVLNEQLLFQQN
ncbi:hypothetical protein AWM70_13615 [Paenibacillus yonginensis]|uniref:SPOR domain-containing protein n=1 Tax=Paenibacillus yonginensis TaxID=1462996 RepID=A0A1B1N271_9BACL|nr:SPOR domain-containing protein [Paenibacillus yonginensis]ANS75505.1 hypothetical protein AWM70_13615 [Paenibacillus yonginensis]